MCRYILFNLDGVGKVSQVAWQGALQETLDHRNSFYHQLTQNRGHIFVCVGKENTTCGPCCALSGVLHPTLFTLPYRLQSGNIYEQDLDRRFINDKR